MQENEIVHIALENLQTHTGIRGELVGREIRNTHNNYEIDGEIEFIINNQSIRFFIEIKQELRNHQLTDFLWRASYYTPIMLVANRIFPKIKEELRQHKIAYLESSGNIYIEMPQIIIRVDGLKSVIANDQKPNRAFTKTGLKMLFNILIKHEIINWPYREIASFTGISLGNVPNVMNGLKELFFLKKMDENHFILDQKDVLLQKWVSAYEERVKPSLFIGKFRMRNNDYRAINLNRGLAYWSGEPAADILTSYIQPEEFILYTAENRSEIINNYELLPSENGNVLVYKKFWNNELDSDNTVPPLLIYADLINKNDRRCTQAAERIKNEYLQN
jgi:hypothetical protein